jgi:hypothetical protein
MRRCPHREESKAPGHTYHVPASRQTQGAEVAAFTNAGRSRDAAARAGTARGAAVSAQSTPPATIRQSPVWLLRRARGDR